MPLLDAMASSRVRATAVTTSSGVAPGSLPSTFTVAGSALGKRSTANPLYENTPSVTRKAISITVKTGYFTQVSASFIALSLQRRTRVIFISGSLRCRRGPVSLFSHDGALVQFAGNGHGNPVTRLQPLGHFKTPPSLIFGLAGGANLPLGDAITVQQKDFVDAVAIVYGSLRHKDGFLFFLTGDRGFEKEAGLQPPIEIRKEGFRFKGT